MSLLQADQDQCIIKSLQMKCDNFMESSLRQLLVLLWQYLLSSVNQKVQVVDINIYSQEWL